MVAGDIRVKVIPDTAELDKELKKSRTFSGLLGLGKGAKPDEAKDDSKGIVGELKQLGKKSGIVALILGSLWNFIKPVLSIVEAISALLFVALSPILIPAFKMLLKMLPYIKMGADFINKLLTAWVDLREKIFDFAMGMFKNIWASIVSAWDILKKGGKWLWENVIVKGFEILLGIGKFLFDLIIGGFKFLFNIGKFLFTAVINGFKFLFNIGSIIWNHVIKPGFNFLLNVGEMIWDLIKGGFDFILTALKGAANSIIRLANKIIPGSRFDIPELADGGIVTKPTLALVGERGPEAVVPLNRAGGSFGGGITQNINISATINNDMDIRDLASRLAELSKSELAMSTGSQRF